MLPIGFSLSRITTVPSINRVFEELGWHQPSIQLYGKTIKIPRLTSWMGTGSYTYSGNHHAPAPMTESVAALHKQVESLTGQSFNSVLANYYRDGSDSVSWHSDNEKELGDLPVIASLSLGAVRTFSIREKATGQVTKLNLGHGDLLVMSGRSQKDYLHCVPKTARAVWPRLNLTFRTICG